MRTVLYLQKNCEDGAENLHIHLHIVSPVINTDITAHLLQQMKYYLYIIMNKVSSVFRFPFFFFFLTWYPFSDLEFCPE